MALVGAGFRVDVEAVERAAAGIVGSVEDQAGFALRGLCGEVDLYGDAGVRDALMGFCVRWSSGLDLLTGDCEAVGETLTRVAQVYRGADGEAARMLVADPAVSVAGG